MNGRDEDSLDGPGKGPLPSAPTVVVRAALGLRRWLLRAADAVVPADVVMFERATGAAITQLLGAFVNLGFADALGEEPVSASVLAERLNTQSEPTERALRALATLGVVTQHGERGFSHGRGSRVLRKENYIKTREFVKYFASESNVRAWQSLVSVLRDGRSGFERVHGVSVWEWFDENPTERDVFAQAMTGMTLAIAPFIAEAYPFGEVSTVCDVAGGCGALLSEILVRHKNVCATLCDSPAVLTAASALFERRGVSDRVNLVPGDIFEAVPRGAELYLLKSVLHDWSDARCRRVLAVVREAMSAGARVLIAEMFLDRGKPDPVVTRSDLQMLVVSDGGRERSCDDYRELLRAAGFAPGRSWSLATVGLIEAIAV